MSQEYSFENLPPNCASFSDNGIGRYAYYCHRIPAHKIVVKGKVSKRGKEKIIGLANTIEDAETIINRFMENY